MASTDARPIPRKNTAYRHYFAIRKNDGTLITTWAGQDSEVNIDGDVGGFADATNEATEIGTTGCGYIDLTAAEMNGDAVMLKVTVTNTDALPYVVTFFPEEVGDLRADANVVKVLDADLTETNGIAEGFSQFFDVAIPSKTMEDIGSVSLSEGDKADIAGAIVTEILDGPEGVKIKVDARGHVYAISGTIRRI